MVSASLSEEKFLWKQWVVSLFNFCDVRASPQPFQITNSLSEKAEMKLYLFMTSDPLSGLIFTPPFSFLCFNKWLHLSSVSVISTERRMYELWAFKF